jgi:hypothetical protein
VLLVTAVLVATPPPLESAVLRRHSCALSCGP